MTEEYWEKQEAEWLAFLNDMLEEPVVPYTDEELIELEAIYNDSDR
jgi:hypothetical protein